MSARQVEPVVVLGLGRFGQSVAFALTREGCEVLAIDRNPELVREVSKRVTMAVEADVTSKEALEQLGVGEYTRAVVAMGDAVESSLVCALVLKENFKIPDIWAKAINAQQAKILRKIGVTEVVYPELEVGRRVAHALLGHRTEYIPTVDGLAYAALPVSRRAGGPPPRRRPRTRREGDPRDGRQPQGAGNAGTGTPRPGPALPMTSSWSAVRRTRCRRSC